MYHVSAQGVDERMINVHYYYYDYYYYIVSLQCPGVPTSRHRPFRLGAAATAVALIHSFVTACTKPTRQNSAHCSSCGY